MKTSNKSAYPQAPDSPSLATGLKVRQIHRKMPAAPSVPVICRIVRNVPPMLPVRRVIQRVMPPLPTSTAPVVRPVRVIVRPGLAKKAPRLIIRGELSVHSQSDSSPHGNLFSTRRPEGDQINQQAEYCQFLPTVVRESDGRNDKVFISVDLWTVTCSTHEDADCFVTHLGGAPVAQLGNITEYSSVFNGAERLGHGNRLSIRKKSINLDEGQTIPPPLFGGKLRFHRMHHNGTIIVRINGLLEFNVNRALNRNRALWATGDERAIFRADGPHQTGLDGNDNLAPFDLDAGEHDHVRRMYFESAIRILRDEIDRAANVANLVSDSSVTISGRPTKFSLHEVETCWDFPIHEMDAADIIEDLAPIFREWGGKSGWVGNGDTLTTIFSNSENLIMYAKKRNRVRMEDRMRPPKGERPYCFDRLTDMIAELDVLREHAATRVNDYLLRFHARRFPRDGPE